MDDNSAPHEAMRVAFWNRLWNGKRQRQVDYLMSTAPAWDVLVLAEVTRHAQLEFAAMPIVGHSVASLDLTAVDDMRYPHGIMVLARDGLGLENARLIDMEPGDEATRPRPERWMAVHVDGLGQPLTIVGWHAPHAAGGDHHVERKRRAYERMTEWLAAEPGPIVLGMDGNNWFEADQLGPPDPSDPFDPEHRFHGRTTSHGLIDTLPSALAAGCATVEGGEGCLAPTHLLSKAVHRMDRIYASAELAVTGAGVDYAGQQLADITQRRNLCAGSDHALVWAELKR